MSTKRLLFLEGLLQKGTDDPMAYYGLAMEYRSAGRVDDSLRVFGELKAKKPDYVAMYLMCGQLLQEADRKDEARAWLEEGIGWARKTGNSHAQGELESALGAL
ncbi:MAG: tetratricopeptide repeat protein [Myxococcales bacterium]|jgi:predicted Zn-dependent protease|nr:tetratricopeptide repeat protein [Myxococcales bacterium]